MSVINILMQLRKVCNHPNLFDPRPIVSPFQMEGISYTTASAVLRALDKDPLEVSKLSWSCAEITRDFKSCVWGPIQVSQLHNRKLGQSNNPVLTSADGFSPIQMFDLLRLFPWQCHTIAKVGTSRKKWADI